MSPSDRLWLHHPHCCHWMRAEPGPVCLMPGLLQNMCARLGGEASVWPGYWAVFWGLLAVTLGTHPYSHYLHFPGLPGSGSWGPTECMQGSRGELGGDTSPMVAVGWETATAWPCEGVDVICKQNTAISKSHPLKLGRPKCLFLFLTQKDVGEFWQLIELYPFSLWESRVWGAYEVFYFRNRSLQMIVFSIQSHPSCIYTAIWVNYKQFPSTQQLHIQRCTSIRPNIIIK